MGLREGRLGGVGRTCWGLSPFTFSNVAMTLVFFSV